MKGIEWHDAFVPRGAPDDADIGIPAVTLQAGEQWFGRTILPRIRLN